MRMRRTYLSRTLKTIELLIVTIYVVVTACPLRTQSTQSIYRIADAAVRPFQIAIRARNGGTERNAVVWSLAQSKTRVRCSSGGW
jgi:hypothetical protein